MSEAVEKKSKVHKAEDTVQIGEELATSVTKGPIEVEGLEDFTPEEIAQLLTVKDAIAHGRYTDITPEHRKLLFVQWLVQHGKLSS